MGTLHLILFPFAWIALLTAISLVVKRRHRPFSMGMLILYVTFMAMLGPIGEIVVGTLYTTIFGHPLWQYRVLPTHSGYTSLYAPVIWGIAGAYLYLTHEFIRVFPTSSKPLRAAVHMFETITLEALLNFSFLATSSMYIFYYTPGDVGHLTSLQTLPFYFALGIVVIVSIKRLRRDPLFYSATCTAITMVVVYMTH